MENDSKENHHVCLAAYIVINKNKKIKIKILKSLNKKFFFL